MERVRFATQPDIGDIRPPHHYLDGQRTFGNQGCFATGQIAAQQHFTPAICHLDPGFVIHLELQQGRWVDSDRSQGRCWRSKATRAGLLGQ